MAKTEAWPGFGERVREQLRKLGYVRPDGSEDISRFTVKHGYVITAFYKWMDTTTPTRENLLKLARDLQCSPSWLLFGDPQQMDTAPLKRKGPTKASGKGDRVGTIRKVGAKAPARRLQYPASATARGAGRRVA
jgi:hypothetical protein